MQDTHKKLVGAVLALGIIALGFFASGPEVQHFVYGMFAGFAILFISLWAHGVSLSELAEEA